MSPSGDGARAVLLLAVDDEPTNLELYQRVFRAQPEIRILVAQTGLQALELLRQHTVDILLADFSMPGMTGVELLTHARPIAPDAIAIMVTAYPQLDPVMNALNQGLVNQVVTKPWRVSDLMDAVRRALTIHRLRTVRRNLGDHGKA